MEIKIIQQKENPFLERKEIMLQIIHTNEPTPSRQELMKEIIKMFNTEEEKVQIDYILSKRGKPEAVAKIKIYNKPIKKKVEKHEAQVNESK